jgi:hypothetical protein
MGNLDACEVFRAFKGASCVQGMDPLIPLHPQAHASQNLPDEHS